jgi:hypothetical protein
VTSKTIRRVVPDRLVDLADISLSFSRLLLTIGKIAASMLSPPTRLVNVVSHSASRRERTRPRQRHAPGCLMVVS